MGPAWIVGMGMGQRLAEAEEEGGGRDNTMSSDDIFTNINMC